jgi:hypothetical protein
MNLIQQPTGSKQCGQACVAMLCGVSIERAVGLVGKKFSTKTKELARACRKLGYHCDSRLSVIGQNYNWLLAQENMLVKITWDHASSWHWIVVHDRVIYDPDDPNVITTGFGVYNLLGGRPTSYLEIRRGKPAVRCV